MKEIFEAIESRIKSPLFGYFVLAFCAINWKVIFYLIVEEKDALARISYFDNNTDASSLFFYPLIVAAIVSLSYPWINYLFLYLCTKPTELRNSLQASSEHKLLLKKQELEKLRSRIVSDAEIELIDRAKRDEELNKIEDLDIKNKLRLEVDRLRSEMGKLDNTVNGSEYADPQKLIDIALNYRQRAANESDPIDRDKLKDQARELESKAHEIILNAKNF